MKILSRLRLFCLFGLTAFLAACSPEQAASFRSSLDQLKARAEASAPVYGEQGPGIQETPLNNLFASAPYDTQRPFKEQYPRVALTVLTAPPTHAEPYLPWKGSITPGCWTLRAKVWRSAKLGEDTPPFQWCAPRDIVPDASLLYGQFPQWLTGARLFAISEETTGNRRTDGPIPPDNPVPTDPAHEAYYGSPQLAPNQADGIMVNGVLRWMGFDFSVHQDRRVWITRFVPATGQ